MKRRLEAKADMKLQQTDQCFYELVTSDGALAFLLTCLPV